MRTHWDESLAATLATLNLADAFAAEGHRYAELGEDGQIQVSGPAPKAAPKAAPKKKRAR